MTDYFGTDYFSCRDRFLDAAGDHVVEFYGHPDLKTEGVGTHVVTIGEGDHLCVVTSGCHGVELPFGSAVQAAVLQQLQVPAHMRLILIHALNSYGAYHQRRFTDANIDLCRNFWTRLPGANAAYQRLATLLNAHPDEAAEADIELASLQVAMGGEFISAIMGGQFSDPKGFSYGGNTPAHARLVLEKILTTHQSRVSECRVLDLHTGVGPHGEPTFVCLQKGKALARARSLCGDGLIAPMADEDPGAGSRKLHPAVGHPTQGYEQMFAGIPVTSLVLEMGTFPPEETLPLLIAEHRYEYHGLQDTPAARATKAAMWQQHAPEDGHWRDQALAAGLSALQRLTLS